MSSHADVSAVLTADTSSAPPPHLVPGAPPRLSRDALARAQAETFATPRRRYAVAARVLFIGLDVFYGRARTLEKFRVLELIARVPYQAWEQAAYVATTHVHERGDLARRIYARVLQARAQQDNEQWHLFVLDELIALRGSELGRLRSVWLPQLIAFVYYQLSWLLYVLSPRWSYRLNADFEDHAEHEYATLVREHPEWETEKLSSPYPDHGTFESLADLFRQISYDERVHKLESEQHLARARFQ
jgi:ubiquinol oxidase